MNSRNLSRFHNFQAVILRENSINKKSSSNRFCTVRRLGSKKEFKKKENEIKIKKEN